MSVFGGRSTQGSANQYGVILDIETIGSYILVAFRFVKTVKIGRQSSSGLRVVKELQRFVTHFSPQQKYKMPSLSNDVPVSPTKQFGANNKPFVVSIEGNIGAGKSTMLQFFEKYNDVELIPEPVAQWCDVKGHNLLGKLYEDPKRWSFQFQSYVQLTRLKLLNQPTNCSVKIIERSIQNNRYCFLENAKKEGSLCGAELEVLFSWYDWLNDKIGMPLDLIVYLRTSPDVAYERLKARGRKEEAGVPMNFIEGLHQSYEDWLINQTQGPPPAPVLVLDADQGIESMLKTYEQFKDEIRGKKPYIPDQSKVFQGAIKTL